MSENFRVLPIDLSFQKKYFKFLVIYCGLSDLEPEETLVDTGISAIISVAICHVTLCDMLIMKISDM